MISGASKENLSRPALTIILLVTLIVIFSGFLFYRSQRRKIINEKQNELAAIASLKINEIENWRTEHIRDGEILQSIIPRNQIILNFLTNEDPRILGLELLERIRIFVNNYDYHRVLLIDNRGSIRLAYPPSDKIQPLNASQISELKNSEISLSDFRYSDELPGKVHMDLQIPLFESKSNQRVRFGTILLRIDPGKKLYPLIQSWPTPSKSSETLLIRREGDSVLFLNELRHQKNTALILKLPLNAALPASRAVQGSEGLFEGLDYRGVHVISVVSDIPGSPWFMVAKVDKKEIYSPLKNLIIATSIIAFLIIFKLIVLILYVGRNQRVRHLNELNATKDKFFSIVSHDLRSPFTAITGLTELLVENLQKEDLINKKINHYAELIRGSSHNALNLLGNLTEWSRLQTDRMKFNPNELDLVLIINDVVELINIIAMQKSITINKVVPIHLKVKADKEMISLVIRNLISNAIKFTNPGGTIHISAWEKGKEVVLEVCDTGIGMKKEIIDKLFRIEENVTTPGTQREPGTGLGLILVKEFISLHGGQVCVESEVGKCTRFSVSLPA